MTSVVEKHVDASLVERKVLALIECGRRMVSVGAGTGMGTARSS